MISAWTATSSSAPLRKLDPRQLVGSPVMLVVEIGAVATTVLSIVDPSVMGWLVTVWLWLTVLFGTLAESVAEGRGKAQAASLRALQQETTRAAAYVRPARSRRCPAAPFAAATWSSWPPASGSPGDGEVIEGVASVDESAVTGESAPVIRESGGDRSAVTGGTTVLSDRIVVRITSDPGQSFVDRMIALVEGSERQRTPNEIALNVLLTALTVVFVVVCATLWPVADYSGARQPVLVLVALLVCLIPTTIGALLSAIGIAGMDRLVRRNVLAMSGRAVEAAGDVDVLLLDKTGTITLGNRHATELLPLEGVTSDELAEAALLSSLADETPEGRSIVELVGARRDVPAGATLVEFSAATRMSGLDLPDRSIRKGAASAITAWVGRSDPELDAIVERVSSAGGTPLVVAEQDRLLGVIHLKDIVKPGMRERFDELRAMGIRTVMITGDNAITAQAIAGEAGRRRLPGRGDARGQDGR